MPRNNRIKLSKLSQHLNFTKTNFNMLKNFAFCLFEVFDHTSEPDVLCDRSG